MKTSMKNFRLFGAEEYSTRQSFARYPHRTGLIVAAKQDEDEADEDVDDEDWSDEDDEDEDWDEDDDDWDEDFDEDEEEWEDEAEDED